MYTKVHRWSWVLMQTVWHSLITNSIIKFSRTMLTLFQIKTWVGATCPVKWYAVFLQDGWRYERHLVAKECITALWTTRKESCEEEETQKQIKPLWRTQNWAAANMKAARFKTVLKNNPSILLTKSFQIATSCWHFRVSEPLALSKTKARSWSGRQKPRLPPHNQKQEFLLHHSVSHSLVHLATGASKGGPSQALPG